jgi:hypothetical protein
LSYFLPFYSGTNPPASEAVDFRLHLLADIASSVNNFYSRFLARPAFAKSRDHNHSGSDATIPTDDIYGAGLDARIGLPGGWMLGAGVPIL